MNNNNHASLKTRAEAQEKLPVRPTREDRNEKASSADTKCLALYYKLDEARKRHNLCRHLLGRAHLL